MSGIQGRLDRIPVARPGQKIWTADQFNALLEAVRINLNITGPNILVDRGGIHIGQDRQPAQRKKWPGKVIAITEVEGNPNQWTYTVQEQRKGTPGYDGWVPKSDTKPREVECFNRAEDQNSDSGVQGTGIDVANLPEGFAHQPIPVGSIVEVTEERLPAQAGKKHGEPGEPSGIEYWIDPMNGADGRCA